MPGAKNWCFTINSYTEEEVAFLRALINREEVVYLVFGREEAPTTGTPHLQGFISLNCRKTLNGVKRFVCNRGHYEVTRGRPIQAATYCKKDGDYEEFGTLPRTTQGRRTDWEDLRAFVENLGRRPTRRELAREFPHLYARSDRLFEICEAFLPRESLESEDSELRDWQIILENAIQEECDDDRTVLFYVDEDGGKGKSFFARYMISKYPDRVQIVGVGRRDDMAYCIDPDKDIFIIDCPRSQSEYLQYPILEMLKDRLVMSNKYASSMKRLLKVPHVIVFMNEHPQMDKLSEDRYSITEL